MSSLNPLMKVGEQVAEVIRVHKRVSEKKARARARYLLRLVGIDHADERMEAYPFELSGGQRQRVMIAMAVANHPKVLIADEPTTALDVTVQKQILELILRLKEKFGMAVVFISHDLNVVKKIANRVLVMRQGVIVEQGSVGNIFNAPIHPYTKELLAAFHHTAPRQDFKSRKLMEARDISVSFVLKRICGGNRLQRLMRCGMFRLHFTRARRSALSANPVRENDSWHVSGGFDQVPGGNIDGEVGTYSQRKGLSQKCPDCVSGSV